MKKAILSIITLFAIFLYSGCTGNSSVDYSERSTTGYTVTYNGNGSTGGYVPSDTTKYKTGDTVTVLANTGLLAKSGYTLTGWTDGTDSYSEGSTFVMGTGDATLNAVWTTDKTAKYARTVTVASNYSTFDGVSAGSDGSVYAAGSIGGTSVFNLGNSNTAYGKFNGDNILLVKYNSTGETQWVETVKAASSHSWFKSVSAALDGSNSVYAAGVIYGTGTFDLAYNVLSSTATVQGVSDNNILLVKYNSSGATQWAKTVSSGSDWSYFYGVSTASDGSVYAAGFIGGTGTFDFGNSVTAKGGYYVVNENTDNNILLVKYNSNGEAQWAKTAFTATKRSYFYGVSATSDSIYAVGWIGGETFDFGDEVTATGATGYGNTILVKYSSNGETQWARTVSEGNYYSIFYSVSATSDGSIYIAGVIGGTGTYNFGNNVTAAGTYSDENVLLIKYNSDGDAQWARTVNAGNYYSYYRGVTVASDGTVYAAGIISGTGGTFNFGNNTTLAGINTDENVLLVKYSSSGDALWAQTVTSASNTSLFYGISAASDSVYCGGTITGTDSFDFGGGDVTAAGMYSGDNLLLVKYK